MKKNSIFICAVVLCTAVFSLTGCPQFDRDITPDYELFPEKEPEKKDDPPPAPVPEASACLKIDKALMASNGKLYASGTTDKSKSKAVLYEITKDSTDLVTAAVFDKEILKIKEIEPGTLFVSTSSTIYKYVLSNGTIEEEPFFTTTRTVLDYITYNDGFVVITDAPFGTTNWYFVKNGESEIQFDFNNKTIPSGVDYVQIPNENAIIYFNTASPEDIYIVRIVDGGDSTILGYCQDSKYYTDYIMKAPLNLINDKKVITANGKVFKFTLTVKGTGYISDWCLYDGDYLLECNILYTDRSKIYFAKDEADGSCVLEIRDYEKPSATGTKTTYKNENGIGIYKIGGKVYFITNSATTNKVNFYQL